MKTQIRLLLLGMLFIPCLIFCQSSSGVSKKGSLIDLQEKPKETMAPTIEILEPADVNQRGIKAVPDDEIMVQKAQLRVRGIALDAEGVSLVYVNGNDAALSPVTGGCEFTADVLLHPGLNKIEVKAVDDNNNSSTVTLNVRCETDIKQNELAEADQNNIFGKYHALIIAVEEYRDKNIHSLDFPVQDAQSFSNVLTKYYTFDPQNVYFMRNPTRKEIINKFDSLAENLNQSDNLLIFYAGHGYWDENLEQGFWLPSDAERHSHSEWLSNSQLRDYIRGIKSKHTLLITDACFSGGIFKTRNAFDEAPKSTQELVKLPSRKAMTSGTMKEVPDKSVFLMMLSKRLIETNAKYLSAETLFSSFREAVINNSPNGQVPQFGEIRETGDEGGDFIFIRR